MEEGMKFKNRVIFNKCINIYMYSQINIFAFVLSGIIVPAKEFNTYKVIKRFSKYRRILSIKYPNMC